MNYEELLQRLETSHQWTAQAILKLQELIRNEDKFKTQVITDMRNEILQNVQLNISEMEILAMELEVNQNE